MDDKINPTLTKIIKNSITLMHGKSATLTQFIRPVNHPNFIGNVLIFSFEKNVLDAYLFRFFINVLILFFNTHFQK